MDRNPGLKQEVKSMVTCATQAQENHLAAEGLRKEPDPFKDDLAQRRIQGSAVPHREAPRFVADSTITEADLETWERLKVSEKARCVMLPPAVICLTPRNEKLNSIVFSFQDMKQCLPKHIFST